MHCGWCHGQETLSGQRVGSPDQGRQLPGPWGLTVRRSPGESCPRSCNKQATEPGMAARYCDSDLEPRPPASPTLGSPSVSMMTVEVLLSGTVCSSRALFSMLMPVISPSLMLVPVTQRAPWEWALRGPPQRRGLELLALLLCPRTLSASTWWYSVNTAS